ncbi:MAG TPA: DNA-3-methyladenine glycosylase 2 family protein [Candidatus Paceibacterota bacterium]|nr:DNA-3-methyladenine glycosylase 2 family protein [Candidatus Paceibacterota bacterium]
MTSSPFVARRADALTHFKRVDSRFYQATRVLHRTLPLTLSGERTRTALFRSLVSIVISQQLGVAAADTIFARLEKACKGQLTSLSILSLPHTAFRTVGLSGAKTKTLKTIATSLKDGSLDLLALKKMPLGDAREKLMNVWGLGPWSVDMFLLFAVGHSDIFSPGDLGLVRSMEAIYGLPKDTPRKNLVALAEKWSPYRTYACLLLWRTRDMKAGSGTRST